MCSCAVEHRDTGSAEQGLVTLCSRCAGLFIAAAGQSSWQGARLVTLPSHCLTSEGLNAAVQDFGGETHLGLFGRRGLIEPPLVARLRC